MKITADTNLLLRIVVGDDPVQAKAAVELLASAEQVAITLQSFCEVAWTLSRTYGVPREAIAAAIRAFLDTENVVVNLPAVEAGLTVLEAGGDFADGIIAHEGQWLGGEVFASFDKKAVKFLEALGKSTLLLS